MAAELPRIALDQFDINYAPPFGVIKTPETEIAYSQWVSPKRTRSYPFARIYNTYRASKVITIIPIIKDEEADGDRDKIQYSTVAWMSLLNIYIVLAYYEIAEKSRKSKQIAREKLTRQKFNSNFVNSQIQEILEYRQSALHWNKSLFEDRFVPIFNIALNCYDEISEKTGIKVHTRTGLDLYIKQVQTEFEVFKNISLKSSQNASQREAVTLHNLEYLVDGKKATFSIENYYGGFYYLTSDEIPYENNQYIIQESKNTSSGSLPKLADIQDGLFKLILFSNMESLKLNNREVNFTTRLKLTGNNISGSLLLPNSVDEVDHFIHQNQQVFKAKQIEYIKKLALEAKNNSKITVQIIGNATQSNPLQIKTVSTPLRYPGGKAKFVDQLSQYLPKDIIEFREPFVGGGSFFILLKQKYPDLKIWINDLNRELILFWKIAQSDLDSLVEQVRIIKSTYADGKKLFEELTQADVSDLSDLERAVRFFVLNRITFSGTVESGGFSSEAFKKRFTESSIDRLSALRNVLQDIKITNLDYSHVIEASGEKVFLYLDPPYYAATKSKLYGKKGNLHTSFDHERFAQCLQKSDHKWLITYDDSLKVRENFSASYIHIYAWELQYGMNNYKQNSAAKGKELLIANYDAFAGKMVQQLALQL